MEINKYPDGSSYVIANNLINTYGDKGEYVFKINSYEDLWYLNQFIDAFNSENYLTPIIIIPNLIDAQADRRFEKNQSSGLKLVCKFLNSMNANFKIFHPHNPEVVEALMDNVEIIDNSQFIDKVLTTLHYDKHRYKGVLQDTHFDEKISEYLTLMSSDAGGFKPLMKLCDKIGWKGHTESAAKYRNPQNSKLIQIIDKEDFNGKDILIIDDISVYGGTFKGLSTLLKERNCGKLYLAVSHMTVQNLGKDPITNYFDKVFTTNSKFDNYFVPHKDGGGGTQPNNLEIIKLF